MLRAHLILSLAGVAVACSSSAPPESAPASIGPAPGAVSGGSAPASAARKVIPVWEAAPDVLPTFTEPGSGPRSPNNVAFGVEIGETMLPDVKRLTAPLGGRCENRSIRTLMQKARESKAKEVDAAKAAGKVDTVTGASILLWRSPRESSPQVRWSCEDVDTANAPSEPGRARPTFSPARLLYVFDSENLPVRLASLQRSWPEARMTEAVADLRQSLADLTARYGPPTKSRGELPPAPEKNGPPIVVPPMRNYLYEWNWPDLNVKLNAVHLPKGLAISEDIEVPVPVRPDAPARKP